MAEERQFGFVHIGMQRDQFLALQQAASADETPIDEWITKVLLDSAYTADKRRRSIRSEENRAANHRGFHDGRGDVLERLRKLGHGDIANIVGDQIIHESESRGQQGHDVAKMPKDMDTVRNAPNERSGLDPRD